MESLTMIIALTAMMADLMRIEHLYERADRRHQPTIHGSNMFCDLRRL
jgi:hypothetical protein